MLLFAVDVDCLGRSGLCQMAACLGSKAQQRGDWLGGEAEISFKA